MPSFFANHYGNDNICIGVRFNRATEQVLELSCFDDCLKGVESKNPYWHRSGLKINFRKVSQEAASEASNEIYCYETGKRMNSNITSTECEDFKNSWSRTIEETRPKKWTEEEKQNLM